MPVLWGIASRHPQTGDDFILTSRLTATDAEQGKARTASRWYRLENPFSGGDAGISAAFDGPPESVSSVGFELAGFTPLEDSNLLADILQRYIQQVRLICTKENQSASASDAGVW